MTLRVGGRVWPAQVQSAREDKALANSGEAPAAGKPKKLGGAPGSNAVWGLCLRLWSGLGWFGVAPGVISYRLVLCVAVPASSVSRCLCEPAGLRGWDGE